jgi:hypothetical protein
MTPSHLAPDPSAIFWQAACDWLAALLRAFGQPARIARLGQAACAALARELKALEALVLKLLLIEAAAHPLRDASATRRAACAALAGASTPAAHSENLADPETWRVRFSPRLPQIRPARRRGACTRRPRTSPPPPPHPMHLARRCEALRRVLADPMPAVARLARKLHALGARARATARRIALARPHLLPCPSMLFAHATVRAHDVAASFRGSG